MGLTGWLLRQAARRPRYILVTAPNATRVRLLAEAETARRGWRAADSAADASLLVVCGLPDEVLGGAVQTVWTDMPSPRARVELSLDATAGRATERLDWAVNRLADAEGQLSEAAERLAADHWTPTYAQDLQNHEDHDPGHHSAGDQHEQPRDEHGDQEGHEGGHEAHMGAPGGLRMADRGPDRDGLKLDRLHVPMGPVLRDWPSGLVVDTTLQGDVIQQATVRTVSGSGDQRFWDEPWLSAMRGHHVTRGEAERRRAASHLDSLGRLLGVAGWLSAAAEARRLRDRVLAAASREEVVRDYMRFERRVRRSRLLRWMLRDLGVIEEACRLPGPGGGMSGDVATRLGRWLTETGAALTAMDDASRLEDGEGPRGPVEDRPAEKVIAVLPDLLVGAELAAARLIVASLDPDLDQLRSVHEAVHA
jgi:hypothetical protein